MSTQTPDQDPSDQANADELEETMNESADENNAEQDPLEQAAAKLAECEETTQRAKDDLLRVQAEMQNVRRRAEQDVEKAHKYGQEKFSIELLAVVDNLERSLEVASNNEDETVKAIYEGVNLTLKSFLDCFTKFNIEAVDPLGEPFDPQLHQAMSIQENAECEPNTVIAVMQKGYTLHGRVIRPAMVMVSK
jgi:molecular chaperone GrpE